MHSIRSTTYFLLASILFVLRIQGDSAAAWIPSPVTPRPSQRTALFDRPATAETEQPRLLDTLLHWFQGDFDNYRQVVQDRRAGFLPREFGGHEHIHCCLIPVTKHTRLAAFYFDGIPNAIFRFRFYRLEPLPDDDTVDTILYTLSKDLERELRACSDAMLWPSLFLQHIVEHTNVRHFGDDDESEWLQAAIQSSCVTLLPNCEVRWSWERDAIQHAYVAANHSGGLHAVMVHGQALVDSQMIPGQKILIRDQLSLWDDQLWIHDRGLDPDTLAFIYGNQKGIPYRMQRVTRIDPDDAGVSQNRRRTMTDPELAWTLGSEYRTPVEYEANMQVIGGSSRK